LWYGTTHPVPNLYVLFLAAARDEHLWAGDQLVTAEWCYTEPGLVDPPGRSATVRSSPYSSAVLLIDRPDGTAE